ncbi:D-alanine--D-alanine ligase family protein [Roseiconus lacunae]|uniref:ATP-grasp domain-containing protein n=1 Tax=Roseiconus lacunae TaxID=2605694 RepID=A0ABT7PC89_9BACT|nr:ATP-grasp domain-containing protein [Roseiconus lacunae]MDM4014107.1 ATP-grasp domain-containing protein [Roseiconus lacunae]WRQ53407.1 ATP-grasp domain-containing protein [Stieleria sp. HD01]
MSKLRVLVLVRTGHVPPLTLDGISDKELDAWKAEFDVCDTLRHLGHEVLPIGVYDDLAPIRDALTEFKPHITFMLLEEFHGVVTYDFAIISYLELMQQPYTGCNPRGLLLSKDKALSKKILTYHRIPTPRFTVFPVGRTVHRPKKLEFPLFVKSVTEDASFGISQASIVRTDEQLIERVSFVHEHAGDDAIVEQYIEGREIYVGVIGNQRLQTFPAWEMDFGQMPDDTARIATSQVKWNRKYQEKHGITTHEADDLRGEAGEKIAKICKRVYRALNMSGYARMDLRLTDSGDIYVLEANANPNIEYGEDFAESAERASVDYESLLQRILNLGLRYKAAWMTNL